VPTVNAFELLPIRAAFRLPLFLVLHAPGEGVGESGGDVAFGRNRGAGAGVGQKGNRLQDEQAAAHERNTMIEQKWSEPEQQERDQA
jgi:hypothetical protein